MCCLICRTLKKMNLPLQITRTCRTFHSMAESIYIHPLRIHCMPRPPRRHRKCNQAEFHQIVNPLHFRSKMHPMDCRKFRLSHSQWTAEVLDVQHLSTEPCPISTDWLTWPFHCQSILDHFWPDYKWMCFCTNIPVCPRHYRRPNHIWLSTPYADKNRT